jgi:TonB family protein
MKIRPEVSSSSGNYTYGTPSTTIPIVQTTQAETSVRVKDGATIVIGGLIKDERIKTVNKIPILGDLPLIKYAFSNTDSEIKKQELVIFLTPHIISGTEDYLEPPVTPPIEEKRFTMTEAPAFERREPAMMDPTLFKKPKKRDYEEDLVGGAANRNIRKVDVAASTDEYYYALKNSIIGSIALPKGKNFNGARGKVRISFFLTPDGKLARGPDVMESSNHKVDQYALNAVKRAAPFSPFPESMGNTEKRFIMDFNFE